MVLFFFILILVVDNCCNTDINEASDCDGKILPIKYRNVLRERIRDVVRIILGKDGGVETVLLERGTRERSLYKCKIYVWKGGIRNLGVDGNQHQEKWVGNEHT